MDKLIKKSPGKLIIIMLNGLCIKKILFNSITKTVAMNEPKKLLTKDVSLYFAVNVRNTA